MTTEQLIASVELRYIAGIITLADAMELINELQSWN